ncbi:MAG: acylneuraminate cytidylyltransferase family protein [Acetobacteraceae bacterium]|nr:acylneuraminate cytidylyltransferase family protein [Acetobacteraceae bacterium]
MEAGRPTLGVIPARGGSKGIPRKALCDLGGRPLLVHTVEAALCARGLDRVVVSTDDPEIAAVARAAGAEVPFLRPAALAGDDAPTAAVLQHALSFLERSQGFAPRAVVTLQPTSPFRAPGLIDRCLEEFLRTGADSVTTVFPAEHHPAWMWRLGPERRLEPLAPGRGAAPGRRQDLEPVYRLTGSVYVTRPALILEQGAVLGGDVRGVVVEDPAEALDIDAPFDLLVARLIWQVRAGGGGR